MRTGSYTAGLIKYIAGRDRIEIFDHSGDDSEHLYLVIEKLDGRDLFQLMQRVGPVPETVALAVAHELSSVWRSAPPTTRASSTATSSPRTSSSPARVG